jgi:hypothetical protein
MTARLLLATVFLCGMVANAHAQQGRLFAAGPIFVDVTATSVYCNIHNSGAVIQNPTTSIHILDSQGNAVENFTTCSTVPLQTGQACTVGVQNDPSVAGELLTCTVLAFSAMAGQVPVVFGTLDVRKENATHLLYVIPLQPALQVSFRPE